MDYIESVVGSEFLNIAGVSLPCTDNEASVSISGKMASKSTKGKENCSTRLNKKVEMELLEGKMEECRRQNIETSVASFEDRI